MSITTNVADIGTSANTLYKYSPLLLVKRLRELSFGLNVDYLDVGKIVQTISSSVPNDLEERQVKNMLQKL